MVIQDKLYTLGEFDAFVQQHDGLFELIDGRIVEKVTSEEHGKIVINIGSELRSWLKRSAQIKGHYTTESSHRVPNDVHNERRPDVAFRLTSESVSTDAALNLMPDFAVEVKSLANT